MTAFAAMSIAVAAWLTPAAVFLVDWSGRGGHRVALLPDARSLAWIALGTLAVAALLLSGRGWAPGIRRHLAPLALLALVAVPYLPWLADRFPLLLVLAGPLRWAVVAAAAAGVLASIARSRGWTVRPPGASVIFVLSALIYIAVGLHMTRVNGPGGDEPHYLMIAQSLVADGDLRIENNHQQREYRAFFGGELKPDFLRRGRNRIIYSIHAPGLPVLIAPAYALGGYPGAVVMVCVLAALALVPLFFLARAIAGAWPATMAWLATAFTLPLGGHAWTIYPEVPGAAITAWTAWWMWSPAPSITAVWLLRGAVLGMLPWLHTKFLALLVPFVAYLIVKLRETPRAIAWLIAPIGFSLTAWLWSFWVMYGVPSPFIPYGSVEPSRLSWSHVPRGVLGSLLDQEFGLLVHAPIYLLALPGLWWLLRDRVTRPLGVALTATAVVFVAAVMRTYMWWGGTSAPARFLVPIAMFASPALALQFARMRGAWAGVAASGLIASIGIWALMVQPPLRLMPRNRSGAGALVTLLEGQAPLTSALPSFLEVPWRDQLPAVLALAVSLGAALALAAAIARRSRGLHGPFWTGMALWIGAVVIFAILGTFVVAPAARAEPLNRSRVTLMMMYDPPRLSAFDYARREWIGDDELWQQGRLIYPPESFRSGGATLLARPVALPAGQYRAAFWFTHRPPEARVGVLYSGRPPSRLADGAEGRANPAIVEFTLPVTARGVDFDIHPRALSDRLARVELRPAGVIPRSHRAGAGIPRSMLPIAGWPGGFVCFLDTNSYPEPGLSWVRGGRSASILVVPAGASLIRVTLHAGAVGTPVSVTSPGQHTRLDLDAHGRGEAYVPVPDDARAVALDVSAAGGFRPADLGIGSADRRYLGVRFGIELLE